MNPFEILVSNLSQLGFYGFLLPFLFVFAVVYGLLLRSKAVTEDQRIIGVISLVIAFFVTGYGGPALAWFFTTLFGLAGIILAAILVIVLFASLSGFEIGGISNKGVLAIIVIIGVVLFVIAASVFTGGIYISNAVWAGIFIIAIMALTVYFLGKK